ncbi:MAG: hypothetical protein JJ979_11990 [Roseibium sp.]|nr:hypothetical protein [Roseibium sp.]
MKISRRLVQLAADMLDLEVAIVNTDVDELGVEKSQKALDSHKKAMERLEAALPVGIDMNTVLERGKLVLEKRKLERAVSAKRRRVMQRERIATKQAFLG